MNRQEDGGAPPTPGTPSRQPPHCHCGGQSVTQGRDSLGDSKRRVSSAARRSLSIAVNELIHCTEGSQGSSTMSSPPSIPLMAHGSNAQLRVGLEQGQRTEANQPPTLLTPVLPCRQLCRVTEGRSCSLGLGRSMRTEKQGLRQGGKAVPTLSHFIRWRALGRGVAERSSGPQHLSRGQLLFWGW